LLLLTFTTEFFDILKGLFKPAFAAFFDSGGSYFITRNGMINLDLFVFKPAFALSALLSFRKIWKKKQQTDD
jgi:hypothetical protein